MKQRIISLALIFALFVSLFGQIYPAQAAARSTSEMGVDVLEIEYFDSIEDANASWQRYMLESRDADFAIVDPRGLFVTPSINWQTVEEVSEARAMRTPDHDEVVAMPLQDRDYSKLNDLIILLHNHRRDNDDGEFSYQLGKNLPRYIRFGRMVFEHRQHIQADPGFVLPPLLELGRQDLPAITLQACGQGSWWQELFNLNNENEDRDFVQYVLVGTSGQELKRAMPSSEEEERNENIDVLKLSVGSFERFAVVSSGQRVIVTGPTEGSVASCNQSVETYDAFTSMITGPPARGDPARASPRNRVEQVEFSAIKVDDNVQDPRGR